MKIKLIVFIAISSLLLSSCAAMGATTKAGAVAGGLAGAARGQDKKIQVASVLVGAVLGAIGGGWLGSQWDERDEDTAQEILDKYPDGKTASWKNPDNQNEFLMTLVKSYEDDQGQQCRSFKLVGRIKGNVKQEAGKACRSSEYGRWNITSA
ncbi:MAG: hypothetical protein KAI83_08480 [Thiomargarita sp.]|nr:hypothetical protein [Thiomargarita sp.]